MVNVPFVAPAATIAVAGTVAAALPDVKLTVKPPVGAGPLRVIVPVDVVPPVTLAGLRLRADTTGAVMARLAVDEFVPIVAVMVADALAVTAVVAMLNVPVVEPEATVTEAGTVALVLFEASVTVVPPVGAAVLIVTVPVLAVPPTTELGLTPTVTPTPGVTVKMAVEAVPCSEALIVDGVLVDTSTVVTVTVEVVLPAGTVTLAGIVATALLEDRLTNCPPVGAGPLNVIVAVEEEPPLTELGDRDTPLTPTAPTVSANVAVELSVPVAVRVTATLDVCA